MIARQLELRPFQKEAVQCLGNPSHVICVSPTGSGKSLIYETVARELPLRCLIVTPLVALARQQARRLSEAGVPTSLGAGENPEGPPPSQTGAWIISPECLDYAGRKRALERWNPQFLVVDECHCLWDWGDGFRPAFNHLPELIHTYSIERSLWLTATLPAEARAHLRMSLPQPTIELGGFALPRSLFLQVAKVPWIERSRYLLRWIANQQGHGLIFVSTREATTKLARLVEASGSTCVVYHAGLSHEERLQTEALIRNKKPRVVVATSAFGMGMDYSHLDWVALWQAPPSLLALAQAVGRAGRAQDCAGSALVLWDEDDFRMLEWMIQGSVRKRQELVRTLNFLRAPECRELTLKRYFDEENARQSICGRCDLCRVMANPQADQLIQLGAGGGR